MRERGKLSKGMEYGASPIRRREMENISAHTHSHTHENLYIEMHTHTRTNARLLRNPSRTQNAVDVGVVVAAVATACKRSVKHTYKL